MSPLFPEEPASTGGESLPSIGPDAPPGSQAGAIISGSAPDALPLVSIVTSVYNGAATIGRLLLSVAQQTYPRIEHIVINDGSDDDGATQAVLDGWRGTRLISRENRGLFRSLNEGLGAAAGELVVFINSDDYFVSPSSVGDLAMPFIAAGPPVDVATGITVRREEDGRRSVVQLPGMWLSKRLHCYGVGLAHCSMGLRRSFLLDKGLLFDESLRSAADIDMYIRLCAAHARFALIGKEIAVFTRSTTSIGRAMGRSGDLDEEMAYVDQKNGVRRSTRRLLRWMFLVRAALIWASCAVRPSRWRDLRELFSLRRGGAVRRAHRPSHTD